MPTPQRRTSKTKRDTRRAHIKLKTPGLSVCTNCSALIVPHRVCPQCGYYKGVAVIEVEENY